jgi:hypothetical protein
MLKTNHALKMTSLIFGFTFWVIFSNNHLSTMNMEVPLCFFGEIDTKEIDAPETIHIQLSGKRFDLYHLNRDALALHINIDELSNGHHVLEITPQKLFLPQTIKLVHWRPSNPLITIIEKNKTA